MRVQVPLPPYHLLTEFWESCLYTASKSYLDYRRFLIHFYGMSKNVYIICGPNGSGKTTVAKKLLPNGLDVFEYVNADEIAVGLSPFNPEAVAIQAGRLMLERLDTLANTGDDFAFETTLSSRHFVRFLKKCQSLDYTINLIYFWLLSP